MCSSLDCQINILDAITITLCTCYISARHVTQILFIFYRHKVLHIKIFLSCDTNVCVNFILSVSPVWLDEIYIPEENLNGYAFWKYITRTS